ncbi:MAG TPA: hypothetical protein VFH77_10930, partial [Streptomyces sp.]|nr:hypothetical protein [Streptomyces sp.]
MTFFVSVTVGAGSGSAVTVAVAVAVVVTVARCVDVDVRVVVSGREAGTQREREEQRAHRDRAARERVRRTLRDLRAPHRRQSERERARCDENFQHHGEGVAEADRLGRPIDASRARHNPNDDDREIDRRGCNQIGAPARSRQQEHAQHELNPADGHEEQAVRELFVEVRRRGGEVHQRGDNHRDPHDPSQQP